MGKIDYSIIGKRFGRLVVIRLDYIDSAHYTHWICKCDCGNSVSIRRNQLTSGDNVSCGCYHREHNHEFGLKHGLTSNPLYKVWGGIKARCLNPKASNYERYGGRGITICDKWKDDFKAFYDWAISNGYKKGLSIDRIDNNGGYEPANCRWVDARTQQNNIRTNNIFTYKGITHTVTEWSRILRVNRETLRYRIKMRNLKDFESLPYMQEFLEAMNG